MIIHEETKRTERREMSEERNGGKNMKRARLKIRNKYQKREKERTIYMKNT